MKTTIDITAILSPDLKSRSAVSDLLLYIQNTNEKSVIIDFAKIEFVTRSFIDEFYNAFLKTKNASLNVELINVSDDIQSIFDTVSHTQTKKKKVSSTGSVVKFDSVDEVRGFLNMLAL